ncbi:ethionine resistance protein [Rhodotorula kratochvilovae]
MFTGSYPSTSPASFSRETSFLQQAVARGQTSLNGAGAAHRDESALDAEGVADDERGRPSGKRRSHGRLSSSISADGRLSPTEEDEEEATASEGEGVRASLLPHLQSNRHAAPYRPAVETTPLLGHSATTDGVTSAAEEAAIREARKLDDDRADHRRAVTGEARTLLGYTLPILATHFLEYSLMATVVVATGHLGETELAAASLSNLTNNVVALSVIQGLCAALDTLCPQAYSSSRPKDTSLYALRTFVLCLIVGIPQALFFWNSEWILRDGLRQDAEVARHAGQYLRILILGLPAYAGFECIRRWLQAQGLMLAPVLALVVAAPLNILLNWLLIWGPIDALNIGFVGAPIATTISLNVMFLVMLAYALLKAPRDAWGGISKDVFAGLGLNMRLGISGIGMVGSEWWSWELVSLASSMMGSTALAAQSVLLTSASFFYQVQYALSVAAAVRIGNLLGAQKPHLARVASRVTIFLAIIVSGVNSILLILVRHRWGSLFSSEPVIIAMVAKVLPLVAAFQLWDGLSGAMGGVLRGAGKPTLGAIINTASYYVLGLPIGIFVAFAGPKLGLSGLWLGLTIALTFTGISSTWICWRIDWEGEAEQTRVRLGEAKRDAEEEA